MTSSSSPRSSPPLHSPSSISNPMPSRCLLSSPATPPTDAASTSGNSRSVILIAAASASSLLLLALLVLFFYLYRRSRIHSTSATFTVSDHPNSLRLRRFPYRVLRSATASFDPSRSLGRGASATVFRGVLPDGKSVAVKRLLLPADATSSSLLLPSSSDHEFQNELQVLAALPPSPYVVSLLGYCLEGKRRRLLVYEYMPNGSLQEALFGSRLSPEALTWERRFGIILDVARALFFLHLECDPLIVHGDIKPSNVLLGVDFQAKISDFGLARVKTEADLRPEFFSQDIGSSQELWKSQDLFSSQSPQVDFAFAPPGASSSSNAFKNPDGRMIPNTSTSSPKGKEAAVPAVIASGMPQDDNFSIEHSREFSGNSLLDDGRPEANGQSGREWWWKQGENGEIASKEYVSEWIGSQNFPPRNVDWEHGKKNSSDKCFEFRNSSQVENLDTKDTTFSGDATNTEKKPEKKQGKKKGTAAGHKKEREMREWWKEEYFAEISKKGHPAKKDWRWFRTIGGRPEERNTSDGDSKTVRDSNGDVSFRQGWKKRSKSMGSEMFSGEFFSKELSSTTSMRGTVCYIAPEYHHGSDHLLEKADIYSFGVLILVIVSGRRPLHLQTSQIKLEKANLVTWCRQLAQTGNILELVDERLKDSYNKDQASLCISLALLCLQKIPDLRPDSGDIVKILKGEMELPVVPAEFSPSPSAAHFSRLRRKANTDGD